MTLKYPTDMLETDVDYVMFQAFEYRTNRAMGGQAADNRGGTQGPPKGQPIILYMPNTTPAVLNAQSYGAQTFEGVIGTTGADIATRVAGGIETAGFNMESAASGIDAIKNQFEEVKSNAGPLARQAGTRLLAQIYGRSANNITVMQRGQIYNPNVELLYEAPNLRSFNFDFIFSPKSQDEASTVNNIIKEFKVWSSPEENGGMFKVPCVWEVTYMTGSDQNKNMNAFKKSAMTGVSVQANPSSDMHNSFSDGMPVVTSMSLAFQEVDIITRGDHEDAPTNQGY